MTRAWYPWSAPKGGLAACWFVVLVAAIPVSARGADADSSGSNTELIERAITPAERDHWAFLPLATDEPPEVADPSWRTNPVDRFIKFRLEQEKIEPLPRAGKAARLRRLTFDLTGLPPEPADVQAFLADESADAYERAVDRLLASPAYGERYAQHWLDLARFAETDGFEHDLVRPNAWRYRDWVIDALQRDLPFDEFLRLQLAGDLIRPADPEAAVATGFLLCGPDMPDINLQDERRHLLLNEMTSAVGSVFLGLQLGCAQCHDHKFDPFTIHDFYRLRAFFEAGDIFRDHPIPTPAEAEARRQAEAVWTKEDRQAEKRHRALEDLGRRKFRERNPDERPSHEQILAELSDAEREEHRTLAARLEQLPKLPQLPLGRVFRPGAPQAAHVYLRGDFRRPGPGVESGFPRVLLPDSREESHSAPAPAGLDRVALADWLTHPEHPLTTRVIANRVWQWHFGVGLSNSPSDFGVMGSEPTHPELLDWLARELVRSGWSLKHLHRLLVTSQAYQLASGPFDHEWTEAERATAARSWDAARQQDPENLSLWRRRRMRLDGESLRDALLFASGELADRRGGPGVRPRLPAEVTATLLKDQWQVTPDEIDQRRRSIYLFVRRNLRYPLFDVFDRPDTNASCSQRHESTTATQALTLLNSEFSLGCARRLAARIASAAPAEQGNAIEAAYWRLFARAPTPAEAQLAAEFCAGQESLLQTEAQTAKTVGEPPDIDTLRRAVLVNFCLALINASEMAYLD
ncbi:MAG: DUF1553 domain-containing protein [Planctomycetaceae bacterium]|nr:DUF1553 domain-containing protein [Planctomycetaceae bacterium]